MNAVCLTIGNMGGKITQELVDERRPLFGVNLDPEALLPKRRYICKESMHISRGSPKCSPMAASSSSARTLPRPIYRLYHPIWFARQNGGPEIAELISFPSVVDPWYQRVAAIGHGEHNDMTPEEAIEVAKLNQPKEPDGWAPEAHEVRLQRGEWVSVTPDDYGNPVHGTVLAWTADEIVIRHEDPSVGKVNVHFPRVGFDVAPAQRLAA